MSNAHSVGIDLGTTNSVVAYAREDGTVEVIPNREGERTTPSVFAVTDCGERLVGRSAVEQESDNPNGTVRSVKRSMGSTTRFTLNGQEFSPESVSAAILAKLKADAEAYLGGNVSSAVITVPAYFDSDQRQATVTAGEIAGLKVLRVISEPTAAAIAYGLHKGKGERVLVYDLGGGTFDVTILDIENNDFQVKSVSGDSRLGGDDFDQELLALLESRLESEHPGVVIDPSDRVRLREAAEAAKKQLTSASETNVHVPYCATANGKPVSLKTRVTRAEFENLIDPLVARTKVAIDSALRDKQIQPRNIDEIVFVGGSTRVPLIASRVNSWLGKTPNTSINPDEAVAVGAAIQAGILSGGAESDVMLLDVIPLTLGIELAGGAMQRMIARNTTIPAEHSEVFSTVCDNQDEVCIRVWQGERPKASLNKLLGEFKLGDIPRSPAGVPQIEVLFKVDANAILSVSAVDMVSGQSKTVTITGASGLSDEEIRRLVTEAERNREEDERYLSLAKARDQLQRRHIQVSSLLRDASGMLSDELNAELLDIQYSLEDARDSKNLELLDQLDRLVDEVAKKASSEMAERARQLIG